MKGRMEAMTDELESKENSTIPSPRQQWASWRRDDARRPQTIGVQLRHRPDPPPSISNVKRKKKVS